MKFELREDAMGEKLLPRDDYRKIKSMSRQEMTDFLYNFSKDITDDAVSASVRINLEVLRNDIGKIKGIGANRLDEIMKVVEKYISN